MDLSTLVLWLSPVFLAIASVYASVGLGGGTAYLAVMTLAAFPVATVPSTALLLNLAVTGTAVLRFGVAGAVPRETFLPFVLAAVPASFAGGMIRAPKEVFLAVLAAGLAGAALTMLLRSRRGEYAVATPSRTVLWAVGVPVGAAIGLLAGFLGIGGGVFLGPFLILARWAPPRAVAAMSSVLILVVSAAGLLAHGLKGSFDLSATWPLVPVVVAGAFLGAHLSATRFSARTIQQVFAGVVLIAAVRAGLQALGV